MMHNGSGRRNGSSGGKRRKRRHITHFTFAQVRRELRRQGYQFVPRKGAEEPFCGEHNCTWSEKRRPHDQLYVVQRDQPKLRTPRPRGEKEPKTTFLVCKRCLDEARARNAVATRKPLKMRPSEFLQIVAEAIDCRLASVYENGCAHRNGFHHAKTPPGTIRRDPHQDTRRHRRRTLVEAAR